MTDTSEKRRSALGDGLPLPDGVIDAEDRAELMDHYRGPLADAPVVEGKIGRPIVAWMDSLFGVPSRCNLLHDVAAGIDAVFSVGTRLDLEG